MAEYEIQGLTAFRRALADMADSLPTSLRDYNVRAATEIVAEGKSRAGYARQAAKAAQSLRASRAAGYVAVMLGNNGVYAFARGTEFGALRYHQFPTWRGNQWSGWDPGPGYYLQPAIRDVGAHVVEEYWQSIRELALRAFPD